MSLVSLTAALALGLFADPPERPAGPHAINPRTASTVEATFGAPIRTTSADPAAGRRSPAPDPASARPRTPRELTDIALAALGGRIARQSHPDALRRAFRAYFAFRAAHSRQVRKPYLFFVDYGLDSHTPRGYVFDMEALAVVEGPFTVAHGRGSAPEWGRLPTRFSNVETSYTSSLGLFLALDTYAFHGTSGGQGYRSVGLRLHGVSGVFNSAAYVRGIVAHGAPYVTPTRAGESLGCPAMEEERARRLLPRLANGGLVFLFSPHDGAWMRHDPWTRPPAPPVIALAR
jgi:hypothetical protein